MDYRNEARKHQQDLIKDLQDYVRCKSVYDEKSVSEGAPFGKGVKNALDYVYNLALKDGFEVKNHDGYCVEVTYGNQEETVMVLAHSDVVPEGEGWKYPPYGAEIHDGLMYGRGTSDDKGPGLTAYYALKILKEHKVPLKRKIKIVFGGNEESGSRCLHHYFVEEGNPAPTYGFTPDAEFPLIYGEKGILTYKYEGEYEDNLIESFEAGTVPNAVPAECVMILKKEVHLEEEFKEWMGKRHFKGEYEEKDGKTILKFHGKASHGAFPEGGINAFTMLLRFVDRYTDSELAHNFGFAFSCYYGSKIGIQHYSDPMGNLTMNVGIGKYDGHKYTIIINIRYPNDMSGDGISKILDAKIMHKGGMVSDSKPLYVDPSSPLVSTLMKIYREESGKMDAEPVTIGGGTYARETQNVVAFGMDFLRNNGTGNIHDANEALNLQDLEDGLVIYLRALEELANL